MVNSGDSRGKTVPERGAGKCKGPGVRAHLPNKGWAERSEWSPRLAESEERTEVVGLWDLRSDAHPLLGKCALTPGPLHLPAPLSGTVFPLLSPEFTILDLYSDLSSSLWWVYLKFYFSLTPSSSWKCESESPSVVSNSLQPHGPYSPWNSLVQRTGVGSRSIPQGTFPTQGSNPGLSHCRRILYQLSHKGSPFCF